MSTEVLAAAISIEPPLRFEMRKRKLPSRWTLVCDVMAWLVLIGFFAGMFFAIKLCLEMGLQLITHEMIEHLRVNHGF